MSGLGQRIVLGGGRRAHREERVGVHRALEGGSASDWDGPNVTGADDRGQRRQIRQTIESEIVPRFMLAYARAETDAEPRSPSMDDVAEFARIVVAHDASTARSFVQAIEAEGVAIESILLELFAPAAKLLGELWAADRCSFADVTVGLSHIERLTRECCAVTERLESQPNHGQVLLAPCPGEQHTLGLRLVADFLQRDGWDVIHLAVATEPELSEVVRSQDIKMLGLSMSSSERARRVHPLIKKVRQISRNPDILVMVGGAGFDNLKDLERAGADATASDARAVVEFMRRHLERVVSARGR